MAKKKNFINVYRIFSEKFLYKIIVENHVKNSIVAALYSLENANFTNNTTASISNNILLNDAFRAYSIKNKHD
jgi:hypothetical protein